MSAGGENGWYKARYDNDQVEEMSEDEALRLLADNEDEAGFGHGAPADATAASANAPPPPNAAVGAAVGAGAGEVFAAPAPAVAPPHGTLVVQIKDSRTGTIDAFQQRSDAPLKRLFDAYHAKKGVVDHTFRFLYADERIGADDTPDSIGYDGQESDDFILATVECTGGDTTATY
ncbi:hypothetical protein B484DRAFT_462930 [Ochromonadaceae sp. CCMP2298]|nr:hypothetical protein B484DRAFT_462930 [Ochromonadaceae sp. CCMP2298]